MDDQKNNNNKEKSMFCEIICKKYAKQMKSTEQNLIVQAAKTELAEQTYFHPK